MISRKDLIDTAAYGQDIHRVILAFNVDLLPEAKEALPTYPLKVFTNDVVYRLIEDYQKWVEEEKRRVDIKVTFRVRLPWEDKASCRTVSSGRASLR